MNDRRKLVVIESPFHAETIEQFQIYQSYLLSALRDSVLRFEAPFASHAIYPRFLDDSDKLDRQMGMSCGFTWMTRADLVAVYTDYGVTNGMLQGIEEANKLGIPVTHRLLGVTEMKLQDKIKDLAVNNTERRVRQFFKEIPDFAWEDFLRVLHEEKIIAPSK